MFRRLSLTAFALLPFLTGCLHLYHEPPAVSQTDWRPADEASDEAKGCVYVFLIDGVDPFRSGSVTPLRDHLNNIGFGKTFYGCSLHASYFAEKIAFIRSHCPEARFVVIGHRDGAKAAIKTSEAANRLGIELDALVLLAPEKVDDSIVPSTAMTFVPGSPGVEPTSLVDNGPVAVPGASSGSLPVHPAVLDSLERELTLIAFGVPPRERSPALDIRLVEPLPSPRKHPAKPKQLQPEWQFLRLPPQRFTQQVEPPIPAETLPEPRLMPASGVVQLPG